MTDLSLETRTIEQLPAAALAELADIIPIQKTGGTLAKLTLGLLLSKLGPTDFVAATAAELTLAHPAGTLALVYADPDPNKIGYHVKTGAIGAGAWTASTLAKGAKGDPGGNVMAIGRFVDAGAIAVPIGTDLVRTSGYATKGLGQADYVHDVAVDAAYVAANPGAAFVTSNGRGFRIAEARVTPQMFGAKGDGLVDDSLAVQRAFDTSKDVDFPEGRYFLAAPVAARNGSCIRGAGKSAWEPYDTNPATNPGLDFPPNFKSQIEVDGTLAFNLTGKNNVRISGFGIAARGGGLSNFGFPANFQAGARGFDITNSSQVEIEDVSFHGLEAGVDGNQDRAPQSAQMPRIRDWTASDCDAVFRFGNPATAPRNVNDPNPYTVRDALIGECVIALHNNRVIDAHWCDGLRIEGQRIFQVFETSIYIRATPFVTINGVTCFETAGEQLVIEDCLYVTIAGANLTRAGAYDAALPYVQCTALTILNSQNVVFSGTITQPTGAAVKVVGSKGVSLVGSIFSPFWTTGNATAASGSIDIRTSDGVQIDIAETGGANWIGVWADEESAPTITGSYATDGVQGTVRVYIGPRNLSYVFRLAEDLLIGAGGTSPAIATIRVRIPPDKALVSRSAQLTSPSVQLRSGAIFWNVGVTAEVDGGSLEVDGKVLGANGGATSGYQSFPLTLHNPTAGPVTVPAGHETRLSLALIDD